MFTKLIACAVASMVLFASPTHAAADDEAYFRQFLYRIENVGNDPDYPVKIYWLLLADALTPIPLPQNKSLYLLNDLKLNDDGTFQIEYNDGIGDTGASTWMPRYCVVLEGTWSVPDKSLIFTSKDGRQIMKGDRHFAHQKNAVMFTFLPAFPVKELRGLQAAFDMGQSNTEPRMQCMFPNPPPQERP